MVLRKIIPKIQNAQERMITRLEYTKKVPPQQPILVNTSNNWIWCRTPKTGGTSINEVLNDDKFANISNKFSISDLKSSKCIKLETNWLYRDEIIDVWEQIPDKFKKIVWTISRNPWDRLVSGWSYCRTKSRGRKLWKLSDYMELEFSDCIIKRNKLYELLNKHDRLHFLTLQSDFLPFEITHQIKLEELQNTFIGFCNDILKIDCKTIPRINISKHDHYKKLWTEDAYLSCKDWVEKDCIRFGYKLNPWD